MQATGEALLLGGYRFDRYRTTATELPKPIRKVTVLGGARADAKQARAALERGRIVAEAVNWARDLVNTPAGDLRPHRSDGRRRRWRARSASRARCGARPS